MSRKPGPPQLSVIRYYVHGEDDQYPNVFMLPPPYVPPEQLTLGMIKQRFPVKGRFHFRFQMADDNGFVWLDVNDDNSCVPTMRGQIIMSVLPLPGGIEPKRSESVASMPSSSAAQTSARTAPQAQPRSSTPGLDTRQQQQQQQQQQPAPAAAPRSAPAPTSSSQAARPPSQSPPSQPRVVPPAAQQQHNMEDDLMDFGGPTTQRQPQQQQQQQQQTRTAQVPSRSPPPQSQRFDDDHDDLMDFGTSAPRSVPSSSSSTATSSSSASLRVPQTSAPAPTSHDDHDDLMDFGGPAAAPPRRSVTPSPPPPTSHHDDLDDLLDFGGPVTSKAAPVRTTVKAVTVTVEAGVPLDRDTLKKAREEEQNARANEKVDALKENWLRDQKAAEDRRTMDDELGTRMETWCKRGGVLNNIRALLCTVHDVLWPESGWNRVNMADLVEGKKVKLVYMKAIRIVHPDKHNNDTADKKYIAQRVFEALNAAWDNFKIQEPGL